MQDSGKSSEAASGSDTGAGLIGSSPVLEAFSKRFDRVVRWLMYIAAGVLFLYVCFMFLDVILRYLFSRPIPYDVDITSFVLVLLAFFGAAYTQLEKGHLYVDLLTSRLRPRSALVLSTAMYIICIVVAGVLTWRGILNALNYYRIGTVTYGGLPLFPATIIMCIGCIFFFVVFLRDLLSKLIECQKLRIGAATWLLMVGLPVLFMVVAALGVYQIVTPLSTFAVGALGILLLFVLIFLGMPVVFALFTVAIIVMGYSAGATPGFQSLGPTLFTHVSSYTWIVMPLYILMSYFILAGGLGTSAFFGAYKWFGHIRGGLGLAVIGGSTGLAAVVGTGTAATVTMGLVAYPEMRKYKYADSLATGCIAAGATLGPIIPPSLPFILYGIITEESIGSLFIAGIVPGLILAASFAAIVLIGCRIIPGLGPAAAKASWSERLRSIPVFGPILVLFILIIGGIYAGVFTVMEGGGIGAFMALVIALASKAMTWEKFKTALANSVKFIGLVLVLVSGGLSVSNSLGASGVSTAMAGAVEGLGVSPTVLVILILFVYMIFGIVCDAAIIILLTIPNLCPMLKVLGIDLIWFGVLTALVGGLGSISPPYAMGIFMLRAIACPDVSLGAMFRGILPFCLSTLIVVILLIAFPSLTLWLPGLMR